MTAIRAELVQYKQMKTKPVIQLIFEAPLEDAQRITETLGWPNPATSLWCGIARLNLPTENDIAEEERQQEIADNGQFGVGA